MSIITLGHLGDSGKGQSDHSKLWRVVPTKLQPTSVLTRAQAVETTLFACICCHLLRRALLRTEKDSYSCTSTLGLTTGFKTSQRNYNFLLYGWTFTEYLLIYARISRYVTSLVRILYLCVNFMTTSVLLLLGGWKQIDGGEGSLPKVIYI